MPVVEKKLIETATLCYHCGSECETETILYQDKCFCCYGCKNVFQLLNENNLNQYYTLENTPGTRQNNSTQGFDYLDDDAVVDKLLDFKDQEKARLSFHIPSIHCASCVWLLENLSTLQPAIIGSEVNFPKKNLTLLFKYDQISLKNIVSLLQQIGYTPQITMEDLSPKKKVKPSNRPFIYKMGVAGFCFGNIMLFSFPEYFHLNDVVDPGFRPLFGYLNLLLSIPVLVYSGGGYFVSAWQGLKHRFINIDVPLALGISVMFIRSSYEIISGTGAGFMDALCGLVFFLLVGKWFQNKTYDALSFDRDYKSYMPISVTRLSGKEEEHVAIDKLNVGDRILIHNNELIPADGILLKGNAWIDYSFVTGESQPVEKTSGEKIYAGGKQTEGNISMQIIKPVSQSYLSELWNQDIFTKKQAVTMSSRVSLISKYFTSVVLFICLLTAIYWSVFNPAKIVDAVTAILIITCPCALALTLPFTFGNALRIYNRNKMYLKNSLSIESMAKINTIVLDKTGTLTTIHSNHVEFYGKDIPREDLQVLKTMFGSSTHPLSKILSQYVKDTSSIEGVNASQVPGAGIYANYGGKEYRIGSQDFVCSESTRIQKDFSASMVHISIKGEYMGYYRIRNEYRTGVSQMLKTLSSKYEVHILSGDNDAEKANLQHMFGTNINMQFKQTPVNKLNYIHSLQASGKKVLMIGDGLNDSGALKQADTGIAIVEDSANFFPACDGILHASSLAKIPQILKLSHICMNVMKGSFFISLLYNLVGLSFAVKADLLPVTAAIIMPLSSISVISFTVLTTNLLARKIKL